VFFLILPFHSKKNIFSPLWLALSCTEVCFLTEDRRMGLTKIENYSTTTAYSGFSLVTLLIKICFHIWLTLKGLFDFS